MPAVFISHSSANADFASDVMAWLNDQGLDNIFLDLDGDAGIVVGEDWERRLYQEVSRCHAVILIVTQEWIDSKWCFAEFSMARSQGKIILPVIAAEGPPPQANSTLQSIQTVTWNDEGRKRLSARLRKIAFDIARGHRFLPGRPPYPGILSFEPEDAAVFFGRDAEIRAVTERLEARRVQGGARLLLVVGPSGSGKSSLVKAGIVPWLEKDAGNWIVVPTFRPGRTPLTKLAKTLETLNLDGMHWEAIRDRLIEAPNETMQEIVLQLRRGRAREASILVIIDQFEELYSQTDPTEQLAILNLLSAGSTDDLPYIFLATIRSDLVGNVLQSGKFDVPHDVYMVGQLPLERLSQVIEGPAQVAGISLEAGLTQRIIRDAQTAEALPLLAFTLREMHDRFGGDGRLSIVQYESLGDKLNDLSPLENSIRRKAEDIIGHNRVSENEMSALKEAFVQCLVRVNIDGLRVRRTSTWEELPELARPLLRRLIDGRLLTSGNDRSVPTIEVAHEALFRAWPQLRNWLDDEQDFLVSRRNIEAARVTWLATPEDKRDSALLTGILLEKAKNWAEESPRRLGRARDFIEASIEKDARKQKAERNQRRRFMASLAIIAVTFALLSLLATAQWFNADAARELAQRNSLAAAEAQKRAEERFIVSLGAVAAGLVQQNPRLALFLASEAIARQPTAPGFLARSAMVRARQELATGAPYPNGNPVLAGDALALAVTPAGAIIAVGDRDGNIQLVDAETRLLSGPPVLAHAGGTLSLAFNRSGTFLASSGADGAVRLWKVDSGKLVSGETLHRFPDIAWSVDFSSEAETLAAVSESGALQVWDVSGDIPLVAGRMNRGEDVLSVALSADGRALVAGTGSGTVFSWLIEKDKELFPALEKAHDSDILKLTISPDGTRFSTVSSSGQSALFSYPEGERIGDLFEKPDLIRSVAFDQTSTSVVGGTDSGNLVLYDLKAMRKVAASAAGHIGPITEVQLGADGHLLESLGRDQTLQSWTVFDPVDLAQTRPTGDSAKAVAISHDGDIIVAGDASGQIHVWRHTEQQPQILSGHAGQVWSVAISEDDRSVLSADRQGEIRQWDLATGEATILEAANGKAVWWVGHAPGADMAIAAGDSGLSFYALTPGEPAPEPVATESPLMSAAVSPDGVVLATGSTTGVATIRDLRSREVIHEIAVLDDVIWHVAFSPDGTTLATAGSDETVTLWEVETGSRLAEFGGHGGGATHVAFLAQGTTLAATDRWGRLHFWDTASLERLAPPIQAHDGPSWRLSSSRATDKLVTAGDDQRVKVWDVLNTATGCQLGVTALDQKTTTKYFGSAHDGLQCFNHID